MDLENTPKEGGRVRIQVTIPDSHHVSGGPFCCFVKVAPIASDPSHSENPVTLDFIALSVYGIARIRNKLMETSKLQNNLRFSFLTEERQSLNSNEIAHLIFSSDSVIFSTCTEITPSSPEAYYRFTCTIPPFIPPTVEGEHVSCNYYVEVTVQYNSSPLNHDRQTLRQKLEFLITGSIYPGVPTLDDMFHPFLPKRGGYNIEDGIGDDLIVKVASDFMSSEQKRGNMFFNYSCRVDALESDSISAKPEDTFLLSHDLNTFWHVWDTMNASGFQNVPEEAFIISRYEEFTSKFTELVLNDSTGKELEMLKPWFGNILYSGFYDSGNKLSERKLRTHLNKFFSTVSSKIATINNTTMENLSRNAKDSMKAQQEITSDDSKKVMNFSLGGNRLCTCSLQGFSQLHGSKEFILPVNSWFSIFFDFPDAFKCLQVEINIVRIETSGAQDVRTSRTCVLQRTLYTLGKIHSNVTMFLPTNTTPTFACSFLSVSYALEICFYHYSEPADFLKPDSAKEGLNNLGMLKWDNPIRVLQNESIRIRSRCFTRDENVTMDRVRRYSCLQQR
ncbi:hypothetical protein BgAZ_401360 [Babesia gibsoni]|uniref:Uncharacterized protein n=1 Tax=Babesia gibsoni TaxID=33632 RepID=A0AAD8LNP8_BABGI|nr:hypothetical protein BgAZ_401360 [Babesia gibsoni]